MIREVFFKPNGMISGYEDIQSFLKTALYTMHGSAYPFHLEVLQEMRWLKNL